MIPADLAAERQRVLGLANGIKAAADRQEYLYEHGDAESYFEDELRKYAAVLVELARVRGALEWYGEQARLCRLIHSEGDAGRHALSADGGERATAALAPAPEDRP